MLNIIFYQSCFGFFQLVIGITLFILCVPHIFLSLEFLVFFLHLLLLLLLLLVFWFLLLIIIYVAKSNKPFNCRKVIKTRVNFVAIKFD